jgi:hypothetical protein
MSAAKARVRALIRGHCDHPVSSSGLVGKRSSKTTALDEAFFMKTDIQLCGHPIFIIGSPRSGSTILAYSLSQHDELWTSTESHFLPRLFGSPDHLEKVFRTVKNWPNGSWLAKENVEYDEFLAYLGLGLNALFSSRSGGKRWIEQTPHYVYMAELLVRLFPGASFIHVLRDGRKVVNSMTNYSASLAPASLTEFVKSHQLPKWATDFRDACREWRRSVDAAMSFGKNHPDVFFTVSYERLVADPENVFSDIFTFLGVRYSPSPAMYLRSNRINSSFPQKSGTPSAALRQTSDPWCNWSNEQRDFFVKEVGDVFHRCGQAEQAEVKNTDYQRLMMRVRERACNIIPPASTILVISKGDDELLNFEGHLGWHFPRTEEGWHAGNPTDGNEAVAQLESMRGQGAQFLLVPDSARWWFEYYPEFRDHLRENYQLILEDDACLIFRLSEKVPQCVAGQK